jgi:4-hydroxy-tetrahydrodipicolinate reductase
MLPEAVHLGLKAVVGTSGLNPAFLAALEPEIERFGGAVAVIPNFSLGALLLWECSRLVFRQYGQAEIVELHSAHKRDKPSATALWLSRELGGVPIHSVRLPGLVAHQEVWFGGEGEVLTLRHDVLDRSAYGPGVVRAVRAIVERRGLFTSLAELLAETP